MTGSVIEPTRIASLDGLRGLAIALVLLMHFVQAPDAGAWGLLRRVTGTGWIGVDLFFVLSGFLITGILLEAKGSADYFKSFYLRRALRILPLYYGFIGLILLLPRPSFAADALGAAYLDDHQSWFWTHTVNWLMYSEGPQQLAVRHGFGALWSLSIEEQFYLAWPFVVAGSSSRRLIQISIGLVLLAVSLRLGLATQGAQVMQLYTATFTRLDAIAVGAILAVFANHGRLTSLRVPYSLAVIAAAGLAVVAAFGSATSSNSNALIFSALSSALALGWGAILLITLTTRGRWTRAMEHPALRNLGKYSFAMYVFQAPVDHLITRAGFGPGAIGWVPYLAVGVATTLAVAMMSWHLWEKHWLELRRYLPRKELRITVAATG